MLTHEQLYGNKANPNFEELLRVIKGQIPSKPVLFEFALNDRLLGILSGEARENNTSRIAPFRRLIRAFTNAGYDFTTISAWRTNTLHFVKGDLAEKESRSLNSGNMISDRESFEAYPWPDPELGDYDIYYDLREELPDGMQLIASGNGGLLENVIDLVGFEDLSMMTLLDQALTTEIFDAVGSRLLRFYEIVAPIETVGACIVNDDWGFKNQTMFSPDMLRRWVFPWHRKIVAAIHKSGKKAILHSCGQLKDVMDEVIDDMKYDAKHSFEDQITPIEEAYKLWGKRISIMGGIDMDFLARSTPEAITNRSKLMLEQGLLHGGYALGSGNSIPEYIPDKNYFAMISAINS
ncbi:MAG: uroporphyrinogen decarboxylase family protein [Candidatus Marinimicrobia bacterium]|nr:uroporphyrinogen decarboxylase family protein [Candidatus Neomarinimicrobiota bacterium]